MKDEADHFPETGSYLLVIIRPHVMDHFRGSTYESDEEGSECYEKVGFLTFKGESKT
jgi:hypothetical protein